ncbi:hypothetical protein [Chitiniphilus eburneus]|uniref:DUF4148 domain-containing protein n=1 Tax=Chitiniphilus eburneus TaxID=2571148 RepID=A0A4U0Q5P8_9NEIS|nr:hypothetical protein [Chitiniphilus eburneus]TJZ75502.1 hypothetical protein FAZ21_06195 [Chitiniphilus eburneus]
MKKLLLCVLALAFTPAFGADLMVADAPLPFDEPAYAVPVSRPVSAQAKKNVKVASKQEARKSGRQYASAKRNKQYASAKRGNKVYASKAQRNKVAKRDVRVEGRQYAANTRR